ncbi:MAG: NAD(P)H-binding protein [Gammaproteobacteria bacterium]
MIGGTGFVGSYLIDELLAQGHRPALLVRPGSGSKVRHQELSSIVHGDVRDPEAVRKTLDGCDAAIYLIGILRERKAEGSTFEELQYQGAKRTIDLALDAGVQRVILMSANGVKPDGTTYQATKYRAEQHLISTELDWTIFRPSVIFGPPRGRTEFATRLYQQIIKPPIPAPLFYEGLLPMQAGTFRLAPIHVQDVARVLVKSLTMPETYQKTYGLCGPEALEWKTLIQQLARAVGAYKLALPVPVFWVKLVAGVLEGFEFFPITRDQITMLMKGNTCDSSEVFAAFGLPPTRFNLDSLAYLTAAPVDNSIATR